MEIFKCDCCNGEFSRKLLNKTYKRKFKDLDKNEINLCGECFYLYDLSKMFKNEDDDFIAPEWIDSFREFKERGYWELIYGDEKKYKEYEQKERNRNNGYIYWEYIYDLKWTITEKIYPYTIIKLWPKKNNPHYKFVQIDGKNSLVKFKKEL
ncbi:MAG: hypothetical protein ABFD07_18550 [Methanobacterium sp.]